MRAFAVVSLFCWLLGACGGQVERDPGTRGCSFPSSPLGQCRAGSPWDPNVDQPCPWVADGLCYADKAAACACACPSDHDSWCASDLSEPGGAPVNVTCE